MEQNGVTVFLCPKIKIFAVDKITAIQQNVYVLAFTCSANKYYIEKPQKFLHIVGVNLKEKLP